MKVTIQPIGLLQPDDDEGALVLGDGKLVAILSRLSDMHGNDAGGWFLETGFGALSRCSVVFATMEDAHDWVTARLAGRPA